MEYSIDLIKKLFYEKIIPNTKQGFIEVSLFDELTNTEEFQTINITLTTDDKESEFYLNIKNEELFFDLLYEYSLIKIGKSIEKWISLEKALTYYLSLIWVNATYEDLNNPETFIQKYINFENNKFFEDFTYADDVKSLNDSSIIVNIQNQSSNFETPYRFKVTIKNGDMEYYLPSISYGISDDCCYIYAIQNKKKRSNNEHFEKKIKRILYKLNANVIENESNEYLEYKNGNEYYPENISDISPSSLVSLLCFLNCLNEKGIENVKVVPFLPIRYKNKEDYYKKLYNYITSKIEKDDGKLKQNLELEHLDIQKNLTEKLIRNFRRLNFHCQNVSILSFPMEFDEYMYIKVNKFENTNNLILSEILDKHLSSNSKHM